MLYANTEVPRTEEPSLQIGPYEVIEQLGAGAEGVVYLVRDRRLDRRAVLKMLRDDAPGGSDARENLLREARLVSAIEHPNVCAIYEADEHEGRPYVVMQYVPGRTLKRLLDDGPLPIPLALSIGIQVADGLAAAHQRGIVHGDLKPANIMVTDEGTVKILDFGLARRGDSPAEEVREQAGSTAYMAPEQFVTLRSSEQTDIFALGIILYEMFTGQHPFLQASGSMSVPVAQAIRTLDPVPPIQRRSDLPAELDNVILKALAKWPQDRYRYTAELRDALKTIMRSIGEESGLVPGEVSTVLPSPLPAVRKPAGIFSSLANYLRPTRPSQPRKDSIAVLPFQDLKPGSDSRLLGYAVAETVATQLGRLHLAAVRSPAMLLSLDSPPADVLEAGEMLSSPRVLTGSFVRNEDGMILNWQLLTVATGEIDTGGTVTLPPTSFTDIPARVAAEIVNTLRSSGSLEEEPSGPASPAQLPSSDEADGVTDAYLDARALLTSFALRNTRPDDLMDARDRFEQVLQQAPDFAPAHAGLALVYQRAVRNGFEGASAVELARHHVARALELDPSLLDARLCNAYTLLWTGDKMSARQEIQHLRQSFAGEAEVHMVAGLLMRLDGLLDEALSAFSMALQLNPANAIRVYNQRARTYLYKGQLELSRREIRKGLVLESRHAILRTTYGELLLRRGELRRAISLLESVAIQEPRWRRTAIVLATCYVLAGRADLADTLITDDTFDAASSDGEIAYRLASYYAVKREEQEAIEWLRTARYLGNENYPMMIADPLWTPVGANLEYRRMMADLQRIHQANQKAW